MQMNFRMRSCMKRAYIEILGKVLSWPFETVVMCHGNEPGCDL